jgi:putative photosynthetic complex assembly protein
VKASLVIPGLLAAVAVVGVCAGFAPRPHRAVVAPMASVALTFSDTANGGVAVRQAGSGQLLEVVAAGRDGFLRSTMRVLTGLRRHDGIGAAAPFELSQLPGDRLVLTDTATGQALELEAFGPSNVAEFLPLLDKESHS